MSAAQRAPTEAERRAISQAIETGVALQQRGLLDDAERLYTGILKLAPKHPGAMHLLGLIRRRRGDCEGALELIGAALHLNGISADMHNNCAATLIDLQRFDEALVRIEQALALDPNHVDAWINRGHVLLELHREEECLAAYRQAGALAAHRSDAKLNEALNQLRLGDFRSGWENYEVRFSVKELTHSSREYASPVWTGEPIEGPLLVSGEQGLGDQILLASMLPDLAARVREVTVEVEPRLVPLFARSFTGLKVVARGPDLYDGPAVAHTRMGDLGRYFRPDWQSFPFRENGYLRCDDDMSARLRARLADGRTVVGLSWSSKGARYGTFKSAQLRDFASVLRLPNCRFVDLQYGDTDAEREAAARDLGVSVERLPDIDNRNDIDALASLICACNIVVTVSNSTAHLAGALGKETYLIVPSGRGRMWFWFRDRDDSPFYPRMRLKRKQPAQPWAEIAGAVAAELAQPC